MKARNTIALALLCLALGALVFFRPLRLLNGLLYDLNFLTVARPSPVDSVLIVGIDPASIAEIGAWPWSRGTIARLIDTITACSPRVVAIDILFPHRSDISRENDSLSAALCKTARVVLPFRAIGVSEDNSNREFMVPRGVLSSRFLAFSNQDNLKKLMVFHANHIDASDSLFSSCGAKSGFINVTAGKTNQKLRDIVQVIKVGDDYYPSFSLSAVAAYFNCPAQEFTLNGNGQITVGNRTVGISVDAGTTPIHFRGKKGSIKTISAQSILTGKFNRSMLQNKLVFLGVTDANAEADFYNTPMGKKFPGVEIWATAALDVIQNSWIRQTNLVFESANALLVFLTFPGIALFMQRKIKPLVLTAVSACFVFSVAVGFYLFKTSWYIWHSENFLYAWLFCLLWLFLSKKTSSRENEIKRFAK